jgi:hypothetical protein
MDTPFCRVSCHKKKILGRVKYEIISLPNRFFLLWPYFSGTVLFLVHWFIYAGVSWLPWYVFSYYSSEAEPEYVQGETLFLGISSLGGTDSAVELIPRWNRFFDVDLKISIYGNAA